MGIHMTPKQFVDRLTDISLDGDVPFGALTLIREEEARHLQKTLGYKGYWALSDGFKCFFLETTGLMGSCVRPRITVPLSEYYALMVPRIVNSFRILCGAEHLAASGYPLPAFTILRNVFDQLVLTSAALQRLTDFYSIEGLDPTKQFDPKHAKKLRKDTEFSVRKKMTGVDSAISAPAIEDLRVMDTLFDSEVHGAQLSLTEATAWLKGTGSLRTVPEFSETWMSAYMNQANGCQWMLHRLLPNLLPPAISMPDTWLEKWRIIDDSFQVASNANAVQNGKRMWASFIEFIQFKFPFKETSRWPL